MHCFGVLGLGGPMSMLSQILKSELTEKYHFETVFQSRPAGGINRRLIHEMARQIRSFRPDILHVTGLGNEGFHALLAGRAAGCRRILVGVHGMHADHLVTWRQWMVAHLMEPYTLKHADGVYCVCAHTERKKAITRNARRLFGYIHNAVEMPPLGPPDPAVRASFGFAAEDTVAVYVGRLCTQKRLLDLCEACRLLAARGEDRLKVLIVGDGPSRPQLEAAAAGLPPGRLVLAGQRNDVYDILRASDFLVLPSLHENLSMAILEAMACQRAVVATQVGGNPEVVVPGETGILIPPRDAAALADAMQSLAYDPERCAAYGVAGRRRAETRFSMNRVSAQLAEVYQKLLPS